MEALPGKFAYSFNKYLQNTCHVAGKLRVLERAWTWNQGTYLDNPGSDTLVGIGE